ncbi:hypothetical protein [Micromonospora endolithica]|uniref:hypothetical protein n=1 Tax=Micromonospora endolithica TaxID=230091 RepID=UPI0011BE44B9|nr:hypothetical protein [Micromonospora endolithica]
MVGALLFNLGWGALAAERRYAVARTTLLTLPSRGLAYLAKLLVSAVAVAAVGAFTALLAVLTVAVLNGGRLLAVPADLLTWAFWQPCLNYLVVLACWPVVAIGVSSLTRGRVLTALFMILWPLFVERLFGALLELVAPLEGVRDWLPFASSRAAMTPTRGVTDSLAGSDLPPGVGLAVFVAFALLVAGAGAVRYVRRDVP